MRYPSLVLALSIAATPSQAAVRPVIAARGATAASARIGGSHAATAAMAAPAAAMAAPAAAMAAPASISAAAPMSPEAMAAAVPASGRAAAAVGESLDETAKGLRDELAAAADAGRDGDDSKKAADSIDAALRGEKTAKLTETLAVMGEAWSGRSVLEKGGESASAPAKPAPPAPAAAGESKLMTGLKIVGGAALAVAAGALLVEGFHAFAQALVDGLTQWEYQLRQLGPDMVLGMAGVGALIGVDSQPNPFARYPRVPFERVSKAANALLDSKWTDQKDFERRLTSARRGLYKDGATLEQGKALSALVRQRAEERRAAGQRAPVFKGRSPKVDLTKLIAEENAAIKAAHDAIASYVAEAIANKGYPATQKQHHEKRGEVYKKLRAAGAPSPVLNEFFRRVEAAPVSGGEFMPEHFLSAISEQRPAGDVELWLLAAQLWELRERSWEPAEYAKIRAALERRGASAEELRVFELLRRVGPKAYRDPVPEDAELPSVSDDSVRSSAKSAARYKGGSYSSTWYNIERYNSRSYLAYRGATKAQLELFDRLTDEAPVVGGRFSSVDRN